MWTPQTSGCWPLDRHGQTPIITRTGSGKFHAYYRHNGERRRIRPNRNVPIDILGGGNVIAPASRVAKGQYQFVQGNLDDLDRLPVMQGMVPPIAPEPVDADLSQLRDGDGRNEALFRLLGRAAHQCDDLDQLLDYARTQNEFCAEPMSDAEVTKIVRDAIGSANSALGSGPKRLMTS